jgi:deoxyribose-phosphate aldolase
MNLNQVAGMVDLSAVRPGVTTADIKSMVEMARQYRCICVTTLPCYTPLAKELLDDVCGIRVSGNVAFPSGGATSSMKIAEARDLIAMGCDELDMVVNVGWLRSGHDRRVLDDIQGVVDVAGEVPVKVILECHYLSDDEIRQGCELCIQAGATFVKTGTGWAPTGATLENVALIKACVGDAIGIKAAGGIRTLETMTAMVRLGARRFGIGFRSAQRIFEQCAAGSGAEPGVQTHNGEGG